MSDKEEKDILIDNDTAVIMLLTNNKAFKTTKKSYQLNLWGKTMCEWVKLAVGECPIKEVKAEITDDVVTLIKPHITQKKYTIVLYADTPLLQRKTFLEIIEYITVKKLSVVKFTRGYIFETEYLKNLDKMYSPQVAYFEEEDFIAAYSLKQLAMVSDILKNRILNYHMKNGVRIIDTATTYIDADVNIEKDVIIEPNNVIKGETNIEKGVLLGAFNIIDNSYILSGTKVVSSNIKNSVIGKNCEVGPFAYLNNESIMEDGSKVGAFVEIKKGKLKRRARVERLSFIGKE